MLRNGDRRCCIVTVKQAGSDRLWSSLAASSLCIARFGAWFVEVRCSVARATDRLWRCCAAFVPVSLREQVRAFLSMGLCYYAAGLHGGVPA
jgi:hypothetical protein